MKVKIKENKVLIFQLNNHEETYNVHNKREEN